MIGIIDEGVVAKSSACVVGIEHLGFYTGIHTHVDMCSYIHMYICKMYIHINARIKNKN